VKYLRMKGMTCAAATECGRVKNMRARNRRGKDEKSDLGELFPQAALGGLSSAGKAIFGLCRAD
jgi:hypothetical protein